MVHLVGLAVGSSCCKFCNNCDSLQLTFLKNVGDMTRNDRLVPPEQVDQLIKRQPNGLTVNANLNAGPAVFGLVDQKLTGVVRY